MIGDKVGARTQALGTDRSPVTRQEAGEVYGLLSAEAALLFRLILNRGAEWQLRARLQECVKRCDAPVADSDLQALDKACDIAASGATKAAVAAAGWNFFDHFDDSDENLVACTEVCAQPLRLRT